MLFIFDKNGYVYKIELDNEVAENKNWFGNYNLDYYLQNIDATLNPKSC